VKVGKILLIILFSVLLLVLVVEVIIYYLETRKGEKLTSINVEEERPFVDIEQEKENLPLELTKGFNPTQNSAVFEVVSVDNQSQTLSLKAVWPKVFEGRGFTAKITCNEVEVSDVEKEGKERISKEEAFGRISDKIAQKGNTPIFLMGLCKDLNCQEINLNCRLTFP